MTRSTLTHVLGGTLFTAAIGAMVFIAAGRIDLPFVWAWLIVMATVVLASAFLLPADLLHERQHPGREGRLHDRHRALVVPLLALSWVLAGVDLGRSHWSDVMPAWLRVAGLVGYVAAIALDLWAMRTNRFFSSVIRVQRDRGHEVITSGPYRFVRHPGYVGMIAAIVFEGFVLGSWVALAPVLVVVLLFLRRTINEDRMLRRDLAGYEQYTRHVRFRLVPGVW
jgi:protein-S-isoprenylcysteine O-methyltransferase Ste14